MCTANEGKPERLTKDETYFKVCVQRERNDGGTMLVSIHNRSLIPGRKLRAGKPFQTRRGYQVFETYQEAVDYRNALRKSWKDWGQHSPTFTIRDVKVKKGAIKVKGEIARGYIGQGNPVMRVSSGTIGGEEWIEA